MAKIGDERSKMLTLATDAIVFTDSRRTNTTFACPNDGCNYTAAHRYTMLGHLRRHHKYTKASIRNTTLFKLPTNPPAPQYRAPTPAIPSSEESWDDDSHPPFSLFPVPPPTPAAVRRQQYAAVDRMEREQRETEQLMEAINRRGCSAYIKRTADDNPSPTSPTSSSSLSPEFSEMFNRIVKRVTPVILQLLTREITYEFHQLQNKSTNSTTNYIRPSSIDSAGTPDFDEDREAIEKLNNMVGLDAPADIDTAVDSNHHVVDEETMIIQELAAMGGFSFDTAAEIYSTMN